MAKDTGGQYECGQSLAEVTIAVSVVLLIITGLISGTSASLRTSQFNRSRSIAVKYAQEAMERARVLRDNGWTTFQSYGSGTGKVWCLDGNGNWLEVAAVCDSNAYIDGTFARTVTFLWDAINERMQISVAVSWKDTDRDHSVTLLSLLTQWR